MAQEKDEDVLMEKAEPIVLTVVDCDSDVLKKRCKHLEAKVDDACLARSTGCYCGLSKKLSFFSVCVCLHAKEWKTSALNENV